MVIYLPNQHVAPLLQMLKKANPEELTDAQCDALDALERAVQAEMPNYPYQKWLREQPLLGTTSPEAGLTEATREQDQQRPTERAYVYVRVRAKDVAKKPKRKRK